MHTHRLSHPLSPPPAGMAARGLPSLSGCSSGGDLAPMQRRAVVVAIVGLHLAAVWALLQVPAVRDQAVQVVPILVDLLAPPAPPTPPAPPRPPEPVRQAAIKRPLLPKPRPLPPAPVLATAAPAPAETFTAPPPPAPAEPTPAQPTAAVAAPAPTPAAAPTKILPDTAVQYLQPPQVDYPRLSRKRGETGQVLVRAYVSTGGGAPQSVEVEQSSGHVRLDQAAVAAVHKARFKPYAEAGRPVEGWALIPIRFELEK